MIQNEMCLAKTGLLRSLSRHTQTRLQEEVPRQVFFWYYYDSRQSNYTLRIYFLVAALKPVWHNNKHH